MSKLKDDVLRLSKTEQYEIYEAIDSKLFGEELRSLTKEQIYAQSSRSFITEGKKVIVFTTADSTSYKISPTDTTAFKHMGQPLETQVCVFVDFNKQYQSSLVLKEH